MGFAQAHPNKYCTASFTGHPSVLDWNTAWLAKLILGPMKEEEKEEEKGEEEGREEEEGNQQCEFREGRTWCHSNNWCALMTF